MRKPTFCICENKGADQLRGNHAADQCLCFLLHSSKIIQNFKPLTISRCCTALFVLNLVKKNPEDRDSRDAAHMKVQ